jgi:hypothetical protein
MQNVSGLRQAPDVDDFDEIFQAAKIHNNGPNQYASLMTSKTVPQPKAPQAANRATRSGNPLFNAAAFAP